MATLYAVVYRHCGDEAIHSVFWNREEAIDYLESQKHNEEWYVAEVKSGVSTHIEIEPLEPKRILGWV